MAKILIVLFAILAGVSFVFGVISCVKAESLENEKPGQGNYLLLKGISMLLACICDFGFIGLIHFLWK